MNNTPTPESIARLMTREEIRERVARIRWNLANAVPACRGSSRAVARRDAARALRAYSSAIRLAR